jgi:hypothetical protein
VRQARRAKRSGSGGNPELQVPEGSNARKARRNGSEKMSPKQQLAQRTERQLSRKKLRAEEHRALISRKPKQKPNRRTCRRRHLAPGVKRPPSLEACAKRRRRYVRYVIRCCLRDRRPKHVPLWWHDDSVRIPIVESA